MVNRVEQHVRMLAVFWIAYAVLHAVGACVLLILTHTIFGPFSEHPAFLHPLLSGIAIFLLAKGVFCVVAGVGLLERQPWARTLVLILAVIALINVPFGTLLGVYTLWVLLSPHADTEYRRFTTST